MLILIAFAYFCLATGLIWLVLFPAGRTSLLRMAGRLQHRLQARAGLWRRSGSAGMQAGWSDAHTRLRAGRELLRRRWAFAAVGVPLSSPVLGLSVTPAGRLPLLTDHT